MRFPAPRALRRAGLVGALSLLPTLAWSRPTPPPPAPRQQLGEVKVVQQTRGTRTIVDTAGRTHVVMNRITPAERKAAAARARATREAAAEKPRHPAASPSTSK